MSTRIYKQMRDINMLEAQHYYIMEMKHRKKYGKTKEYGKNSNLKQPGTKKGDGSTKQDNKNKTIK